VPGQSKPERTGTPFRAPEFVPLAFRAPKQEKIKPERTFQGPKHVLYVHVPFDDQFAVYICLRLYFGV